MVRESGKEIGFGVAKGILGAKETLDWISSATAPELLEYIRGVGSLAPTWSQFGRDALNVVLANENIKLQKDIRDMTVTMKTLTQWVTGLTVIIAILTLLQVVPIVKSFIHSQDDAAKTSLDTPKSESNTDKTNKTDRIQNQKNETLNKTKTIDHKEPPNK